MEEPGLSQAEIARCCGIPALTHISGVSLWGQHLWGQSPL
jgi:hypothetical protein